MNIAAIGWLIVLVICIVAEASTVTVVSLWFAAGALVAMIAALLGLELWLQALLFIVVSVVLLLCFRPMLKRYFIPKIIPTNKDALIGTPGVVTVTIDNNAAQGTIKLGAMEWTARSSTGEIIKEGTLVTVDKIEGVKAFVTPAPVTSNLS